MKKNIKYKGVRVNALGLPIFFSNNNLTVRLKKEKRRYSEYRHFIYNYPNTASKDLIIICNISPKNRSERDWLRYQLGKFNYIMIQKNVWVGPSPLPKDFIQYIKSIGLFNKLKILRLSNPY